MPRKAKASLPEPLFSEPVFNENGAPTPDPTTFRTPHDPKVDDALYNQVQNLLKKDTVSFATMRGKPGDVFSLQDALGSQGEADVAYIQNTAKQIVFHAIGDSGATSVGKLSNELHVADHLANDVHSSPVADRPAFLYHLGDVVYSFGESKYYYDQFYEPFRNYAAPIFAIPGNHDSFVIPGTAVADMPLTIFSRNFCATSPVVTTEAGSLHRTAMTQPGVYFTLDAPFVRIIGLFSNALEDPGVISSQKGQKTTWPGVPDVQLAYLTAQLQNIKSQNYAGAVIIAVHHPPFGYSPPAGTKATGGTHVGNTLMLREIDTICKTVGVYPHAFLSGHAHNYQRYTRKLTFQGKNYIVPFVVSGDGGYNVTSLVDSRSKTPPPPPADGANVQYLDVNPVVQATGLTIAHSDQNNYGYLRITVNSKQLQIEFHPLDKTGAPLALDTVKVDLASHTIVG